MPALVPVQQSLRAPDGSPFRSQVLGNAFLIIAPNVDTDGCLTGGFSLVHVGTGLAVRNGDPGSLRDLAERIAHLPWADLDDPATFRDSDMARETLAAIRAADVVETPGTEKPVANSWGGDGIPRLAEPLIRWALDRYQRSYDKTGSGPDSVPFRLPDPDAPDGEGQPNPEWYWQINEQVNMYGVAYLVGALRAIDPQVADSAAAALADAWDAGDSLGEWVWQWRQELDAGKPLTLHGIPAPVGDLLTTV